MSVYEKNRPFSGDSFLVRIICHSQKLLGAYVNRKKHNKVPFFGNMELCLMRAKL